MEKELLKKLIQIPSYFDKKKGFSERKLGLFIEIFFQKNFPNYKIFNLNVENKRENLLIIPKNPRIIFCCHLDTVLPSKKNHTKLIIKNIIDLFIFDLYIPTTSKRHFFYWVCCIYRHIPSIC